MVRGSVLEYPFEHYEYSRSNTGTIHVNKLTKTYHILKVLPMLQLNARKDLYKYIILPNSNFRAMFEKILKEDVLNPNKEETTKKRNGKRNRPVEVIEEVSKVPQRKKVVVTDEMKFHDVDVEHWRVSQTVQWLKQIDLSHLSTLFSSMNGLMLMSCTWCSSAVFERE